MLCTIHALVIWEGGGGGGGRIFELLQKTWWVVNTGMGGGGGGAGGLLQTVRINLFKQWGPVHPTPHMNSSYDNSCS